MKCRKKIVGLALAALSVGIVAGFIPSTVSAESGWGTQILCYSASHVQADHDYIDCLTCTRRDNREYEGESGHCYPSKKGDDPSN